MEYKDYYRTLGLERDASKEEIKRAYRRLARKYHPDVSTEPDAEARFKDVSEAYEVLHDPEKRSAYDQLGANWRQGHDFKPPPGWDFHAQGDTRSTGWSTEVNLDEFSDFFASLFGGAATGPGTAGPRPRQRRQASTGATETITISLEEAYTGCTRELRIRDGRGGVRSGRIRIPAGVTDGRKLRLPTPDAPGGDRLVEVRIAPHARFQLDGRDVRLTIQIMPWELALGTRLAIPTPGGMLEVRVPPGSRNGQTLRLRGRGLPGSPPGDELVTLEVVVPQADTDAIRAAYGQLRAAVEDPSRGAKA